MSIKKTYQDLEKENESLKKRLDEVKKIANESDAQLESLLTRIPDMIFTKNTDGTYLKCNKIFAEFIDRPLDKIAGYTDYDFFDKELADFFRENDKKSIENKKHTMNEELLNFPDGSERYYEMIKTPFFDNEGKPLGMIGIGRDVSKRKRDEELLKARNKELKTTEEELRQYIEELHTTKEELASTNEEIQVQNKKLKIMISKLKEAQKQIIKSEKMASLGIFTAGIAHEINNPINFVYTGINSLKKDFDDVQVILDKIDELSPDDIHLQKKIQEIIKLKEEYYFDEAIESIPQTIEDILIGATRTAEIVEGLRNFSRIDTNKTENSDIHKIIETSILILKNKYKDTVDLTKNFSEDIPNVNCNIGKLSQAFVNIISNAIDAINEYLKDNERGKIIISTFKEERMIKISIKDNGGGMSEKIRGKLFDPFFTTKGVGKGTGLGLAITHGIIEEHNGTIEVKTELGKGTEFIIGLPI